MLYSLHVKNLALIKEQEIEFSKGLNILTGETGAGKSVVIGSVNLALGAKADAAMIRTGEEYALVELVFGLESDDQRKLLEAMDIPVEEDGTVVIQRKLMPGRSISKVCGESVSSRQLKDISNILINIHGQNDHQELLHKKKHLEILDDYCMDDLKDLFSKLSTEYDHMKTIRQELAETDIDENARIREQELLEFETDTPKLTSISAGREQSWTLDTSYLNPVPTDLISTDVSSSIGTRTEVSVTAIRRVTGAEVVEVINAMYGGDLRKARISEFGLYSGVETTRTHEKVSGGTPFAEAGYVQLASHMCTVGHDLSNENAVLEERCVIQNGSIITI